MFPEKKGEILSSKNQLLVPAGLRTLNFKPEGILNAGNNLYTGCTVARQGTKTRHAFGGSKEASDGDD